MSDRCTLPGQKIRYELRFSGHSLQRRGYAFPCDEMGVVDLDELTERNRANYFFARAVVGKELSAPVVTPLWTESAE